MGFVPGQDELYMTMYCNLYILPSGSQQAGAWSSSRATTERTANAMRTIGWKPVARISATIKEKLPS